MDNEEPTTTEPATIGDMIMFAVMVFAAAYILFSLFVRPVIELIVT